MTSVPGLRVKLLTRENEQFEGLCRDLESSQQELVTLVAFPPGRAPAIGMGEKAALTFLGGGLVASIDTEGIAVLRSDDQSRRCYSFHVGDVPKSMLMLLANRRGSTRLAAGGAIRVRLLDVPGAQVELHDISATGLSIVVEPTVEEQLLEHVRLRFSLMLPGEEPLELIAAIRHRRILKSQILYGLEIDGQMPGFMRAQERFHALSVLK